MKKGELENLINYVKNIKNISDKQSYNISTAINQNIIKILPILEKEYERLDMDKITVNCPAIIIIKPEDFEENIHTSLSEYINQKMQELVINEYKIIDFGIQVTPNNSLCAYIKYTS